MSRLSTGHLFYVLIVCAGLAAGKKQMKPLCYNCDSLFDNVTQKTKLTHTVFDGYTINFEKI